MNAASTKTRSLYELRACQEKNNSHMFVNEMSYKTKFCTFTEFSLFEFNLLSQVSFYLNEPLLRGFFRIILYITKMTFLLLSLYIET